MKSEMTKISKNKTEKQKIGEIGESLACRFLEEKGYEIIGRNYLKPWGEIDVVAHKDGITVFVEVKTVTRVPFGPQNDENIGTRVTNGYRPEDNLHPWKLKRLTRAINSYLVEKRIGEGDWRFDVITVYLNPETKKAKVEHLQNIVL
ncbi:MAG: YraN family protein [bacterium]|nr:YraN family protein [bacterium]